MPYTSALVDESKDRITAIIAKYGGLLLNINEDVAGHVSITFQCNHTPPCYLVRISVDLPIGSNEIAEQHRRRKWLALYNYIEAEFVAVDEGIKVSEEAFMAWIVGEGDKTMYERAKELGLI